MHPEAVYAHSVIKTKVLAESLVRIGEYVAEHGIEGDGPYQPARDLLLRSVSADRRPSDPPCRRNYIGSRLRIAPLIEGGVLPIQGPPGTGKTYTARG